MVGIFFDCKNIKSIPDISKWNIEKVVNLSYMFFNCEKIEVLPEDISNWNIFKYAKEEDLKNYLMSNYPKLQQIDFDEIKDFIKNDLVKSNKYDLFLYVFNEIIDFAKLMAPNDFIKVIIDNNNYSIASFFTGCSSLKSLLDISKWDTSKVTNIFGLFAGCSSLRFYQIFLYLKLII